MVDYSKWDAMKFSDSDSEDSHDDYGPRVTSLNQPGQVTIGKDGSIDIDQSSSGGSLPRQQKKNRTHEADNNSSDIPVVSGSVSGNMVDISSLPRAKDNDGVDDIQQQRQQKQQKILEQLTRNGGKHTTIIEINKSDFHLPIYWSQDRYVVTLRVGFPTRHFPSQTIRVKIVGALKYEDRHSAVGSGSMMTDYIAKQSDDKSFGTVTISSVSKDRQDTILFHGLLPRPIYLNQDEEEVDYDIETANVAEDSGEESYYDRFVSISMPKAVPMHGMVLWWDCPIVGFPEIDVTTIQERNISNRREDSEIKKGDGTNDNNTSVNIDKKEAFQKAWDEAHVMFREKMKKKEKQIIS